VFLFGRKVPKKNANRHLSFISTITPIHAIDFFIKKVTLRAPNTKTAFFGTDFFPEGSLAKGEGTSKKKPAVWY
jgi:hypothetical protein